MEKSEAGYELYKDVKCRARNPKLKQGCCASFESASICAEAKTDNGGSMGIKADLIGGNKVKVMAHSQGQTLCVQAWVHKEQPLVPGEVITVVHARALWNDGMFPFSVARRKMNFAGEGFEYPMPPELLSSNIPTSQVSFYLSLSSNSSHVLFEGAINNQNTGCFFPQSAIPMPYHSHGECSM